mgnify:CR=1 FL=1
MASILLPVPQILQNPELPNGCEITSCCEVLHYLLAPDKCELADYYLPRSASGTAQTPTRFIWAILTWTMAAPKPAITALRGRLCRRANATWLCRAAAAALMI